MSPQYIVLLLTILPSIMFAQGYHGKTISITPHVSGFYSPDRDFDGLTANLEIEKTFTRSISIGIGYHNRIYQKTISWNSPAHTVGQLGGYGYGIFLKKYFAGRGAIAPLGSFFQIGTSLQSYKVIKDTEVLLTGLNTFAIRMATGLNWHLAKDVMAYAAIEAKYEGVTNKVYSLAGNFGLLGFDYDVRAPMFASFKLGLTFALF